MRHEPGSASLCCSGVSLSAESSWEFKTGGHLSTSLMAVNPPKGRPPQKGFSPYFSIRNRPTIRRQTSAGTKAGARVSHDSQARALPGQPEASGCAVLMLLSCGLWITTSFLCKTNYVNSQRLPQILSDVPVQICGAHQTTKDEAPAQRPQLKNSNLELE